MFKDFLKKSSVPKYYLKKEKKDVCTMYENISKI